MTIAPVVSKISVKAPPARAFDLFVNHMAEWWANCSSGDAPVVAIVIEPKAGGRWYEHDAKGRESEWGKVLAYEPPHRLLLGWGFNADFRYDPDILTELELTFTANEEGGTDVRLEHRNLERLGTGALEAASRLGGGWAGKLAAFAIHANQSKQ